MFYCWRETGASNMKQRIKITFCANSANGETLNLLKLLFKMFYGENVIKKLNISEWHRRFKERRGDLGDGRKKWTAKDPQIRLNLRLIAEQLDNAADCNIKFGIFGYHLSHQTWTLRFFLISKIEKCWHPWHPSTDFYIIKKYSGKLVPWMFRAIASSSRNRCTSKVRVASSIKVRKLCFHSAIPENWHTTCNYTNLRIYRYTTIYEFSNLSFPLIICI